MTAAFIRNEALRLSIGVDEELPSFWAVTPVPILTRSLQDRYLRDGPCRCQSDDFRNYKRQLMRLMSRRMVFMKLQIDLYIHA